MPETAIVSFRLDQHHARQLAELAKTVESNSTHALARWIVVSFLDSNASETQAQLANLRDEIAQLRTQLHGEQDGAMQRMVYAWSMILAHFYQGTNESMESIQQGFQEHLSHPDQYQLFDWFKEAPNGAFDQSTRSQ